MIYRFLKTWLLPIVALIAVGIALVTYESDYLFKVQELNLFLYSKMFFEQQMVVSGGLLARHLFHSVFLLSSPWHHVVVSVVRTHDVAL